MKQSSSRSSTDGNAPWNALLPLLLGTMTSQALLVVLGPALVAIGGDLGASVGVVGQARSVAAGAAIAASVVLTSRIGAVGVPRLLRAGAALAALALLVVAVSSSIAVFLAAHALVGVAFACLLSGGFGGVASFDPGRRAWAMGYVASANAAAWIVVNPLAGVLTSWLSWRAAMVVPGLLALLTLVAARSSHANVEAHPSVALRTVLRHASARRWAASELTAYAAWTAFLTFVGAFLIERLGMRPAATGWALSSGPAAYVLASTRSAALVRRFRAVPLAAAMSMAMALLLPVVFGPASSVVLTLGGFVALGLAAGLRTPVSGGLGLAQLPDHPTAMMATRTATTQSGYLLGGVIGGVMIELTGFGGLGLVLAAGMLLSAALVLRVEDPRHPDAAGGWRRTAIRRPRPALATTRARPGAG